MILAAVYNSNNQKLSLPQSSLMNYQVSTQYCPDPDSSVILMFSKSVIWWKSQVVVSTLIKQSSL